MSKLVRIVGEKASNDVPSIFRSFVDIKQIKCIGGKGGNGALAFSKHGPHRMMGPGMPVGGRGGNGGNVYAEPAANGERIDLSKIPTVVIAKNGFPGKGNKVNGSPGDDIVLKVPLGTLIYKFEPFGDLENWKHHCKNWKKELVADITSQSFGRFLLAQGGLGGSGNNLSNPYKSEIGTYPKANFYEIKMKLIADVGLLGLPNVGKSTLFSSITNSNSRVGDFPFTTTSPHVGKIKYSDGFTVSVVDLPGIINQQMNNSFLTQLDRVKVIIYLIDPCNPTYNVIKNFDILRQKLLEYGLSEKPCIIVTSKMDIACKLSSDRTDQLQRHLRSIGITAPVVPVSAKYKIGLESTFNNIITFQNWSGRFANPFLSPNMFSC